MTNIVSFLKKIKDDSLVLFDELGAGTDPTEGAALAIAILSHLHAQGIRTMATTHYSELKIFALETPGVENASCEFRRCNTPANLPSADRYFQERVMHLPFAKKLGLPDYIIEDARAHLSSEAESFEDVLTDFGSLTAD